MSTLQFFKEIFESIWDGMSNITVPLLNISVTQLLLGMFVAGIAIGILYPILGIGGGISNTIGRIGRSVRK